jgi:transcriptional regulator with XRE-family HTH domain
MAELLSAKVVGVYPSTVAKIENGDRVARIDEISAVADVFGMSLDTLIGRSTDRGGDEMRAFRSLLNAAQQAVWQAETTEATLRERVAELAAFGPAGAEKVFVTECDRACDILADAQKALRGALNPKEGKAFQRMIKKFFIDDLKEGEDDGA